MNRGGVQWRNTEERWGAVAQALHWLIALALLGQMALGWVMVSWRLSPTKLELYAAHKSLGITLFVLVLARLAWRFANVTPPAPPAVAHWEVRAARWTHALLYLLLMALPITGYLINSATNFPLVVWGVLPLPNLTDESEPLQLAAETAHLILFCLLAALVVLHVGAALRHHWVLKDPVLRRMLPALGNAKEAR
ncbi:MAG TPA: cytochrome b [Pseudomonadales bacterium]